MSGTGVERRSFIAMPFAAAVAALGIFNQELNAQARPETVTFDDFVAEAGALAKKVTEQGGAGQADYLYRTAALAERIDRVPDAKLGEPYRGIIRTGINYRGSGIVVVQWSMEKELIYPPHNHPNYNGLTLGIDGECRFRNFDIVGEAPELGKPGAFSVRETQSQLLTPGRVVSLMEPGRNNIHTLQTRSKPVRGIDVMALVGKHIGFAFVQIDGSPSSDEGVYAAKWGEHLAR